MLEGRGGLNLESCELLGIGGVLGSEQGAWKGGTPWLLWGHS